MDTPLWELSGWFLDLGVVRLTSEVCMANKLRNA